MTQLPIFSCVVVFAFAAAALGCDESKPAPGKKTTVSSGTVDASKKVAASTSGRAAPPPPPLVAPTTVAPTNFALSNVSAELRTDKVGKSHLYVFFDAKPEKPSGDALVVVRASCRVGKEVVSDLVRARGVEQLAPLGETFKTDAALWNEEGIKGSPSSCTIAFESRTTVLDTPLVLGTYCFKPPWALQEGACVDCPLKGS